MQLLLQLAPETVKVISLVQLVLMLHAHRAIAFNIRKCLRTYLLPFLLTRLPQNNKGPTPEEISENQSSNSNEFFNVILYPQRNPLKNSMVS